MITFGNYSCWYPGTALPTLDRIGATVAEGDFSLVVGHTGSGKSSLLAAVAGTAAAGPGSGTVTVAGRRMDQLTPREAAGLVGVVGQDPLAGFATDTVAKELAHRMLVLELPPAVVRRRVEDTLDLMGIAHLRARRLATLSGGEQQRVALGSVLALGPRVLVLDEPTSALDPAAAEDALAAVLRLVHDVGVTVVAAEHRLERVVEYADQLLVLHHSRCRAGDPATLMADSPLAPPVVELGRLCGWLPLPLSVRDARRVAGPLRAELAHLQPPPGSGGLETMRHGVPGDSADGLDARSVVVRYGTVTALRQVDLHAWPGEIVALMGRNGSGKSTLLRAVSGSEPVTGGQVRVAGREPCRPAPGDGTHLLALVPQQAAELLRHASMAAECAAADHDAQAPPGSTRALYDDLSGGAATSETAAPAELSQGQRLALALAVRLVAAPRVVLLDEPTRGLDYRAKTRLRDILHRLANAGSAIVVATHDVEFVAQTAQRVVVLAEGEAVASGPVEEVLASSPVFAPQVAKILAPQGWLTTEQVSAALSGRA